MTRMYVPEVEETFLNFATSIILEAAQKRCVGFKVITTK